MRSVIAPSDVTTPMMASSRVFDEELALAALDELPLESVELEEPETLVTEKLETTCTARSLYGD